MFESVRHLPPEFQRVLPVERVVLDHLSDVEADFKAKNRNVDFTWVDKMEKFKVPPESMQQFLKDGGIQPVEGGKR